MRRPVPIVVVAAYLLASAPLFACSCAGVGPACTEAISPRISAVFLGTAGFVWPVLFPFLEDVEVTFTVQEAFKGVTTKKVTVRTASSGPACGFSFKRGEQYLVYAHQYNGRLYTSICTRTFAARFRKEDLEYLRKMKTLPRTSDIYGNYKRYTYDPNFVPKHTPNLSDHYFPPEEYYRAMAPMTGETVTLKSGNGKELKAKIDSEGRFAFRGLPPGKYAIEVTVPPKLAPPTSFLPGIKISEGWFEVLPRGCAQVTFRTEPDGHIAGRIVDSSGNQLLRAAVRIWKPGEHHKSYGALHWEFANDDGTFDLGPLPPGEYILGWYLWKLPHGRPRDSPTRKRLERTTLRFYPGTADPDKAQPIVLGFGEHIKNLHFVIPFDPAEWKETPEQD